jgi:putative endonuclease
LSTVEVGRAAETVAAEWLSKAGFTIVDRNWRNRWCEIDIVAEREGVISFVEVKYRRRPDFGTGFEYITPDKIRRLQRAALMWLSSHYRTSTTYQIDVIAVSGYPKPQKVDYLPNAIAGG